MLQLPGGAFLVVACCKDLGGGLEVLMLLQDGACRGGPEYLPGGGSNV